MKLRDAIKTEWPDQADRIIGLIDGSVDPFSVRATDDWRRQCYHDPDPSNPETIMHAINAVINGYGSEAIWSNDSCTHPAAEYINLGDTYDTTVLYDYRADRYRVTSWGDWVERHEKRYSLR